MNLMERINEEVSIYDLFDLVSPPIKYITQAKPCQVSCPFHGEDNKPSARVYPDSNSLRCYFCSKSWSPATFWAEANQWYTDSGKLDIGRSLDDLAVRYDITVNTFDWQKKFYALKKQEEDSKVVSMEDKLTLHSYYAWEISKVVQEIPSNSRGEVRSDVLKLWEDLDRVELDSDTWEADLKNWYAYAKVKVHGQQL